MKALGRFFKMIMSWFRWGVDSATEAGTNRAIQATQEIEDRRDNASDFRRQLVKLSAQNKMDVQELEETNAEIEKYDKLVDVAVDAGNDEHAEKLLAELTRKQDRAEGLSVTVKANEGTIEQLRTKLEQFEQTTEDDASKLARLKAKRESEAIRAKTSNLSTKLGGRGNAMQALEDEVNRDAAMNDAADDLSTTSVEDIAAQYSAGPSVSDRLAARKAKRQQDTSTS